MSLFRLGRHTPMVTVDEIPTGAHWTAAERNVRTPVGVFPQEAPDPIRQGATPGTRRASIPVVTFMFDMNASMMEDFRAPNVMHEPASKGIPRGRQTPEVMRQNIEIRNHIAYGSLFSYDPTVYGMR
jgi:hypothetical protein